MFSEFHKNNPLELCNFDVKKTLINFKVLHSGMFWYRLTDMGAPKLFFHVSFMQQLNEIMYEYHMF